MNQVFFFVLLLVTCITIADSQGPPTNLQAVPLSPRSVRVTWRPVTTASFVSVLIKAVNGTGGGSVTIPAFATQWDFFGLEEYTWYDVIVQADFSLSLNVSVRTWSDVPSAPPQNVTAASVGLSTIRVTWKPPDEIDWNGLPTGYIIKYINQNSGLLLQFITTDSLDTVHVSFGLVTSSVYNVEVAMINVNGTGPFSYGVTVELGKIDPSPPVLTGEAISGTQVLLSWQPPADSHGAIISYDIQYKFSSVGEYIKSLSVSTSSRTATIDSLLVGTEYNFKIRAQTDNGPGPFSEEITLSTFGPVLAVDARVLSLRSILVTWTSTAASVFSYTIFYEGHTNYTNSGSVQVSADATSFTITELEEYTMYTVTVQANYMFLLLQNMFNSSTVSTRTWSDKPSSPTEGVVAVTIHPSSIRLTWETPDERHWNGPLTGYVIKYSLINLTSSQNVTVELVKEHTLAGLVAFKFYVVQVALVNVNGTGPFSSGIVVQSGQDYPASPRLLQTTAVSGTQIMVTWRPPIPSNGIILHYIVQYKKFNDSQYSSLSPLGLEATITGLQEGEQYNIRVRAYTIIGGGSFSDANSSTYGPPTNVTAQTLSPTSIAVTWEKPHARVVNFTVFYIGLSDYTTSGRLYALADVTSVTIDGLEEDGLYDMIVQANYAGSSLNSSKVSTRTLTYIPNGPPLNVIAVGVVPSAIRVMWDPPDEIHWNGPLTGYYIRYTRLSIGNETQQIRINIGHGRLFAITSLIPLSVYKIEIAAENIYGIGPFSDKVFVQSGESVPSAPHSLTAKPVSGTQIFLSWQVPTPSHGNIIYYVIIYKPLHAIAYNSVNITSVNTTVGFLAVGTLYDFRVKGVTIVGEGPYSETVTVSTYGPPTNVKAIVRSPRSVLVTWTPTIAAVKDYIIFYVGVTSYTKSGSIVSVATATNMTISELEEDGLYTITVQANYPGFGYNSSEVLVRTWMDVPSGPPRNIVTESINPSSIRVTWEAPDVIHWNGPLVQYIIRSINLDSGTASSVIISGLSKLQSVLPELDAFTLHSIQVAATSINGTGPFSEPVNQMSGEDTPSAPLHFSVLRFTSTEVTLSWQEPKFPNGVVQNYEIQCKLSGHTVCNEIVKSATTITIKQLTSGRKYQFSARAFTSVGAGPFSNEVTLLLSTECPNGMVYKTCGSPCPLTCDSISSRVKCNERCVFGCFCPDGEVLSNGACVNVSDCPDLLCGRITKMIDLGPGLGVSGNVTVDVGECIGRCVRGSRTCVVRTSRRITVQLLRGPADVDIVEKCSCVKAKCGRRPHTLRVFVGTRYVKLIKTFQCVGQCNNKNSTCRPTTIELLNVTNRAGDAQLVEKVRSCRCGWSCYRQGYYETVTYLTRHRRKITKKVDFGQCNGESADDEKCKPTDPTPYERQLVDENSNPLPTKYVINQCG